MQYLESATESNAVILGSEAFVVEMKEWFLGDEKADRDLPALRIL
jgi:hypothetical protein